MLCVANPVEDVMATVSNVIVGVKVDVVTCAFLFFSADLVSLSFW
jgi:hypothetical protein